MHSSGHGGHSGKQATLKRIQTLFFWNDIKSSVISFIKHCPTCQKCKYDQSAYLGLLQPIPIPVTVCEEVTMDFIIGLPKSNGKEVILVVIDRLSKYGDFIALTTPSLLQ